MNEEKEVYFDQYCKSCKYHGLEESKDPCNDCLAEPSNTNSHKPMNLDAEKKDAIDIATELCYSEEVKRKIAQAKSVYEIGRILKQARLDQE